MHLSANPQNITEIDVFVKSFTLSAYFTPRLYKHFLVFGWSERVVSSKSIGLEGGISDSSGNSFKHAFKVFRYVLSRRSSSRCFDILTLTKSKFFFVAIRKCRCPFFTRKVIDKSRHRFSNIIQIHFLPILLIHIN